MLKANNGICALSGDLTFATTAELKTAGEALLQESAALAAMTFDLAKVGKVDSSALALFLAWLRAAKTKSQNLQFINIPQALAELADLYSLSTILPLQHNECH